MGGGWWTTGTSGWPNGYRRHVPFSMAVIMAVRTAVSSVAAAMVGLRLCGACGMECVAGGGGGREGACGGEISESLGRRAGPGESEKSERTVRAREWTLLLPPGCRARWRRGTHARGLRRMPHGSVCGTTDPVAG